jgi:hypothetical protein
MKIMAEAGKDAHLPDSKIADRRGKQYGSEAAMDHFSNHKQEPHD